MTGKTIHKTLLTAFAVAGLSTARGAVSSNMLYRIGFDTIGSTGGMALQLDGGTKTTSPVALDSGYRNYITKTSSPAAKFGTNAVKTNGGTMGLIDNANGLANVANGYTMSFWFYLGASDSWRSFFGFGTKNGNNFRFEKSGNASLSVYGYVTADSEATTTTLKESVPFTADAWNHVAVVCEPNAESAKIYVNGTAVDLINVNHLNSDLSQVLFTWGRGATGADAAFYRSDMSKPTAYFDEFALYDFPASSEQVRWLASNQASEGVFKYATIHSGDIKASEINSRIASSELSDVVLVLSDNATLTLDAALNTTSLRVYCAGSVTIAGATSGEKPSDDELAKVDLFGVEGIVYHDWSAKKRTISLNFGAERASVSGNANSGSINADIPSSSWMNCSNATGTVTGLSVYDPSTKNLTSADSASVTWSSRNTWNWDGATTEFLKGYLDDGGDTGPTPSIAVTGVPFTWYDVVVYVATDTENAAFRPVNVNGILYKGVSGAVDSTTTHISSESWGEGRQMSASYGLNAVRVPSLSGPVTIRGFGNVNSRRGSIAAVQIVESSAPIVAKIGAASYSTLSSALQAVSSGTVIELVGNITESEVRLSQDVILSNATDIAVGANIVGNHAITKTGAGTLVLGGTSESRMLTVAGGTVRTTNGSGLGANIDQVSADSLSKIVIENGATLDLANSVNTCYDITSKGGTITNSSDDFPLGSKQTTRLTLAGDTTVSGNSFGLLAKGYNATSLVMGGCKLTVRMNDGKKFYFCSTTITGGGTIDVVSGECGAVQSRACTATDGTTLKIGATGTFVTVGSETCMFTNVDNGGTIAMNASNALTVTGKYSGSGTINNLSLPAGATVEMSGTPSTVTGTLTIGKKVNATGAGALSGGKLFKVTNSPSVLPHVGIGSKVFWTKYEGEDILLYSPGFVISVR